MSQSERRRRFFSEGFKRQKVREIEQGATRIAEVCRQYEVSDTAVRKWLRQYGVKQAGQPRLVVESQSDTQELLRLKQQVAELERLLGQKQILIEFTEKMIELAEDHYGVDIKKKFSTPRSGTSGKDGKPTPSA